jgi:hypothetical protein
MPSHLSEDLKWRAVYLWLDGHKPKEIRTYTLAKQLPKEYCIIINYGCV